MRADGAGPSGDRRPRGASEKQTSNVDAFVAVVVAAAPPLTTDQMIQLLRIFQNLGEGKS